MEDHRTMAPSWRRALAGGLGAAAVAAACTVLTRAFAQVRSLPERLLEWMLLFVPLDLFGAMLARFGFETKRYALYGAVVVSLALLGALGAVALRRGWPQMALLALGPGLWLIVMVVIMPLTSAGLFAGDL